MQSVSVVVTSTTRSRINYLRFGFFCVFIHFIVGNFMCHVNVLRNWPIWAIDKANWTHSNWNPMAIATLRMLSVPMKIISIIRWFLLYYHHHYYNYITQFNMFKFSLLRFNFIYILLSTLVPLPSSSSLAHLFRWLFFNSYTFEFCINVLFLDGRNCKKRRQHFYFFFHRRNSPIRVYYLVCMHIAFASVRVQKWTLLTSRNIIYDLNRWALFWHSSVQRIYVQCVSVYVYAVEHTRTHFFYSLFSETLNNI